MDGGGVALIGTNLVPMLSGMFGHATAVGAKIPTGRRKLPVT